jgi:hypothetical protein
MVKDETKTTLKQKQRATGNERESDELREGRLRRDVIGH